MGITFGRTVWAVACAIVTSACYFEKLPLFGGVLSHWAWNPFVKLTYGAYLMHPVIVKTLAGNMVSYFNYSTNEVVLHAFGHSTLSYAAAIAMWCLVEKPFATLSEAMMPKTKSKPPQLQQTQEPVRSMV